MRAVVQRVTNADVKIDGRVNGKIDDGLLVLLGVGNGDTEEDMKYINLLCTAIAHMADVRILAMQWSLSVQMKCTKNLLHILKNKVYIPKRANLVLI